MSIAIKFLPVAFVCFVLLLVGCGGSPKSSGNNKWLDYGNGIINLSQVSSIKFSDLVVTFDDFQLQVANNNLTKEEWDELESLQRENYQEMAKRRAEMVAEKEEEAKEMAADQIERIRRFLTSSSTYMKL